MLRTGIDTAPAASVGGATGTGYLAAVQTTNEQTIATDAGDLVAGAASIGVGDGDFAMRRGDGPLPMAPALGLCGGADIA